MLRYITRLRRQAQIYFVLAFVILVLMSIFVVWPNYRKTVETKQKIIIADEMIVAKGAILEIERDKYRDLKKDYSLRAESDGRAITIILPSDTAETDIIRMLESEAISLAGDDPASFSLKLVNFGSPEKKQERDYFALPFKINMEGEKDKIIEFVRFLEKTGSTSIGDNAAVTRLLEVQSIDLQLPQESADEVQISLSVNAFFMPEVGDE